MPQTDYDAIIIGGGPAGATTATVLAQHGHKVLLLEREQFPRYHVGESLMPYTWHTFDRLGVLDWFEQAACPQKHSVQFVSVSGQVSEPFYFFETIKHPSAKTWQVLRSEFDQMMLENAKAKGVEIRHGVVVRDIITDDGSVVGARADVTGGGSETFRAKVTVDATGRDTFIASQLGWKQRDPDLNKISIFTYFRGAKRDPGIDEGATTVAYLPEKGWFWYIPLANDMVSVGVVGEADYLYRDTRDPEAIFCREAENCLWIKDHISTGSYIGPMRVTGEFSYRSKQLAGNGFCLVGDSFAFLDPVFSSGIFLALKGGEMAADAIHEGLLHSDRIEAGVFKDYEHNIKWMLNRFRRLVLAFYNQNFSFGDFIRAHPDLQPQLVNALIGNVSSDLEPLFDALGEFSSSTEMSNQKA